MVIIKEGISGALNMAFSSLYCSMECRWTLTELTSKIVPNAQILFYFNYYNRMDMPEQIVKHSKSKIDGCFYYDAIKFISSDNTFKSDDYQFLPVIMFYFDDQKQLPEA